ncbi:MAG: helix-turn-helix transcriptional regulator [Flavobacteriaceae bacterium]|jgi:transcriptional regulator with XRE-family HTH domain|nr:helix-turn-helix transcriptional regulator [Flavobacteriaceae bacterium]
MITHSKIIDRVKKIISTHGLTNSSFADKIGVPRSSISHVLSGRNNPSLDLIIKILQSFDGISANYLLSGDVLTPIQPITDKDQEYNNMTLFPELDLKKETKEEIKIDEDLVKSVILVYENNKFEILKNK